MEVEPSFTGSSTNTALTSPGVEFGNGQLNSLSNLSAKKKLGHVEATSKQYQDDGLDWAIIRITGDYPNLINSVRLPTEHGEDLVDIIGIAGSETISSKIWALTASNGPVKGRMSIIPYYLKMPGCTTFQKTWTAWLESNVGQ